MYIQKPAGQFTSSLSYQCRDDALLGQNRSPIRVFSRRFNAQLSTGEMAVRYSIYLFYLDFVATRHMLASVNQIVQTAACSIATRRGFEKKYSLAVCHFYCRNVDSIDTKCK
jgi:hypothetical protein